MKPQSSQRKITKFTSYLFHIPKCQAVIFRCPVIMFKCPVVIFNRQVAMRVNGKKACDTINRIMSPLIEYESIKLEYYDKFSK
jgi:hypothetical protein